MRTCHVCQADGAARVDHGKGCSVAPGRFRPASLEEAYEIQDRLIASVARLTAELAEARATLDALGLAYVARAEGTGVWTDEDQAVIERARTALDGWTAARELETMTAFVARVNARAEAEMLRTGHLTGAHHRALEAELAALPARGPERPDQALRPSDGPLDATTGIPERPAGNAAPPAG